MINITRSRKEAKVVGYRYGWLELVVAVEVILWLDCTYIFLPLLPLAFTGKRKEKAPFGHY